MNFEFCDFFCFFSLFKMWFLKDASGDKISEFFPSQAKLAVHMQMTPQSLQKAVRKGKTVFQFHGQEVRVVQQRIPQFAVFDFPPSENPIETFELVSEAANWLKVPAQTVYAAIKRGKETKVKNKEGGVFWLKKLEEERVAPEEAPEEAAPPEEAPAPALQSSAPEEAPAPALQGSAPEEAPAPALQGSAPEEAPAPALQGSAPAPALQGSAPAPALRKLPPTQTSGQEVPAWLQNFPQLFQNLPQVLQLLQVLQNPELGQNLLLPLLQQQSQGTFPEVLKQKLALPPLAHEIPVEPPIPWAVADVWKRGKTHPFTPPHKLHWQLFVSAKNVAQFMREGLQGRMEIQGAKTKKLMLLNDKLVYIPDLIKEIFVFYIRAQMFTNEKLSKACEQMIHDYVYLEFPDDLKYCINGKCLVSAKKVREPYIYDVVKEFMKLIF